MQPTRRGRPIYVCLCMTHGWVSTLDSLTSLQQLMMSSFSQSVLAGNVLAYAKSTERRRSQPREPQQLRTLGQHRTSPSEGRQTLMDVNPGTKNRGWHDRTSLKSVPSALQEPRCRIPGDQGSHITSRRILLQDERSPKTHLKWATGQRSPLNCKKHRLPQIRTQRGESSVTPPVYSAGQLHSF
ncbi:hypothetical protein J6590_043989 [Homalodisca vitripennis]|nr:hypothetical protein J6590_043989 [Homalodisca vitripennis]